MSITSNLPELDKRPHIFVHQDGDKAVAIYPNGDIEKNSDHYIVLQDAVNYAHDKGYVVKLAPGKYVIEGEVLKLPNEYVSAYGLIGTTLHTVPNESFLSRSTTIILRNSRIETTKFDKNNYSFIYLDNLNIQIYDLDTYEAIKLSPYNIYFVGKLAVTARENVNVGAVLHIGDASDNSGLGSFIDSLFVAVSGNKNNKVDCVFLHGASWYKIKHLHINIGAEVYPANKLPDLGYSAPGVGTTRIYAYWRTASYGNDIYYMYVDTEASNVETAIALAASAGTGIPNFIHILRLGGAVKLTGVASDGHYSGGIIDYLIFEIPPTLHYEIFDPAARIFVRNVERVNGPGSPIQASNDSSTAPGPYLYGTMYVNVTIPAGTYSAGQVLSFYVKNYLLNRGSISVPRRITVLPVTNTSLPVQFRGVDMSVFGNDYLLRIDVIFYASASPTSDETITLMVKIEDVF